MYAAKRILQNKSLIAICLLVISICMMFYMKSWRTEGFVAPTLTAVVSTYAGTGASGSQNGYRTTATFNLQQGIVFDSIGNLYVTDTSNHRIRKIDTSDDVTTFSGTGIASSTNGNILSASFDNPVAIAIDLSNNLYVAEYFKGRIRKIDTSGNVTTFAGTGVSGSTNGYRTSATFKTIFDIAFDSTGNLYVCDTGNRTIRKIDTSGTVTTYAGNNSGTAISRDGNGTSASFNNLSCIAIDSANNIYITDMADHIIRKIDTSRNVTTFAGTTGVSGSVNGYRTSASFKGPKGIKFDSIGNLYVCDTGNKIIRKIDTSGNVTTIAGTGISGSDDGNGNVASFNMINRITIDSAGNLYVSDTSAKKIRKIAMTLSCGSSQYNNAGSCAPLPTNSSLNSTRTGYVCDTNYYNNGTSCTKLPDNSSLNSTSNGYVCNTNYYNNGTSCIACPSNATCTATGYTCKPGFSNTGSACREISCNPGQYRSGSVCLSCGAGTSSSSGALTCTTCELGTYSTTAGSSNCTVCQKPTGTTDMTTTSTGSTSSATCRATKCSTGYSLNNGACTQCGAGTYSAGDTASSCTQCGVGTYSSSGASACTSCGNDKYTNSSGSTSSASCLTLPVGARSNATGGFICDLNYYKTGETCTVLPSNADINADGTGYSCRTGFYKTGTSCTALPSNAVINAAGTGYTCSTGYYESGTSCIAPPMNASVNNAGTGYVCDPGFYKTDTACAVLPSNAMANTSGSGFKCAVGFSQSETGCIKCDAGTYNGVAGATSCSACGTDFYSLEGASNCINVPSNSIANSNNTGFICNSNYYNGGTSCISLPSNSTVDSNGTGFVCDLGYSQGLTSCARCGVGTYNSVAGSSNCTTCEMPVGASAMTSPQGSVGQSNCMATSCMPGHGFASGNCIQCGAGFFGSGGTTSCIACSTSGYTTPVGSSNASACYCPNTNLPPKAKGSAARLLSALNTCIPDGTNVYNFTIGTTVTTTNPCTGQSFYDFDKQACVNYLGEIVSSDTRTVCDSNSAYSQETNACVPVRTIVKPNNPQLTGTTGQPGPGDYNNCKTVDQGDCTLLFKGTNGAYTTTNPCLANGTKYNFATKACSSARNPCCSITNPAQAASRGCSSSVENVFTKNPAKCPPNSKTLCCNQAQSTNSTCQNNGFWKNTLQFKQSHRTACALTSPFTDYGINSKIDTIADKRAKRLIRISA